MAGEIASFRALSREGHAAMSMRGETDRWILIQKNTFTNWVNEQLRQVGSPMIEDLQSDFCDGIRLCALIEALQEKKINRVIKKPINQHQELENVTKALNAVANDNIRLVNIGSEDIVNGNLKLILGLIWHLILRYQIGKTKFPAKKLMLAWLKAVIPECNITNFTSDWNDGVALHALLDYCRPGLCPDWRRLDRSERLENCRNAMTMAKNNFEIPLVVRPEDLSSPDLDELSGMTYISYYMKIDSPGYHATMRMIRGLLKHGAVTNFTTDWADGKLLCNLVKSLGGNIPGWPNLNGSNIEVLQMGIDGARTLGVEPVLTAKEMADPEVDHIGIMAYAAYFSSFKPAKSAAEKVVFAKQPWDVYVNMESSFSLRIEDSDVSPGDIRAEIKGPDSNPPVHFNWSGRNAEGVFTPKETGIHRLNVFCENSPIVGCPVSFKAMADRSKIYFSGVEKCPLGLITELKVNAEQAGQGDVQCEARAPGGRVHNIAAVYRHGNYVMNFNPTEVGVWQISVLYDGDHINNSPFQVHVYDPTNVKVYGLEGGVVGTGLNFNVDSSQAGDGDVRVEIEHEGSHVPAYIHSQRFGLYKIDFTPQGAGTYTVHVFFNDNEVRGSPYTLDIVDSSRVSVHGDGLRLVPCHRTADFIIDTHGSSKGKVDVEITGPNGGSILGNVKNEGNGIYNVDYMPLETGDHKIQVYYCGQLVRGCPFVSKAYDAGLVIVSNVPKSAAIGAPAVFDIDASKAGSGNIEIMVNGGRIACSVQNHGNYRFTASFIPDKMEPHVVEMKFNGVQVKGSPWKIPVLDPKSFDVSGDGLKFVKINKPAVFKINYQGEVMEKFQVFITGPSGRTVPSEIVSGTGEQRVEYVPVEIGDHRIEVKFNDSEVEGSPFLAKAYDASAITVTPISDTMVGQEVDFKIDVTRAGEGQLEIMINNGNLPNNVEMERTGVYKISFVPIAAGTQTVDINFNKESIPGAPMTCMAVDAAGVSIQGLADVVAANRLAAFTMVTESSGASDARAEVVIYTPSGEKLPVRVSGPSAIGNLIEFTPTEAGIHHIDVKIGKHHITGSPYQVKVIDPSQVKVYNLKNHFVGNPCTFNVDASAAGEGILELLILADGKTVPHRVISLGDGQYEVRFTGREATRHRIHLTFNEQYVPGSPFWVEYFDEVEFTLAEFQKHQFVSCWKDAGFTFNGPSGYASCFHVEITGPSGVKMSSKIRESEKGKYAIEWVPVEVGSHLVEVYFFGKLVKGFPYVVKVFDPHRVKMLTNYEIVGKVGDSMDLFIDVSQAGEGQLEIIVECEGETIPNTIKQEENGMFTVTFVPQRGGAHKVYLKFNEENVPGSPFIFEVRDDRVKVNQAMLTSSEVHRVKSANVQPPTLKMNTGYLRVHENQWFFLESSGVLLDPENLTIFVIDPHGSTVESQLYTQVDGSYKVEWTPRMAGRHRVEIMFAGREIDGSPFYVDVIDLGAIHLSNFRQGGVGEAAGFDVDFDVSNMLDYSLKIMAPSGRYVDHTTNRGNDYGQQKKEISYIPDQSGPHEIYITYAGFELPGCPFIQNIDEGGLPIASGDGLYRGEEDKTAMFFVDVGNRKGDLNVQVDGPNSIAKCSIDPSDTRYGVTYVPVEVGIFTITIKWNGKEIPGSPFNPRVVDPRKVRVQGGWQQFMDSNERVHLVVGEEKRLPFDISQAGPGKLRAEVVGPSASIPVTIDDHTMGQSIVCFTPEEEGNHYIHLFWADLALPNSPFLGYAVHGFMDANKVVLMGRGLKEATVREEAEFIIDGSQAGPGTPEVTLTGVRAEIGVQIFPLGNGKFRCVYIPVVPGAYLLHITWNGRQLRGSPYKVNIIGAFYPNKVVVSGEGLKGCLYGRHMDIGIDTRKAGPGELTASCMGPAAAAYCELEDHHDGTFYLRIKPQEIGRHVLQIKYGGEHVNGSPFAVKVGAQPDAGKVRVTGPGVEHGILANFQSRFIVETRGAGAGQLSVRIRGPKGAFQVEMFRESQKDRTILCRFDPVETGLYIIHVKWSGVDVPGSPFHVHIVDSQQELQQVLHEQSFGSSAVTPRSYAQWREEI